MAKPDHGPLITNYGEVIPGPDFFLVPCDGVEEDEAKSLVAWNRSAMFEAMSAEKVPHEGKYYWKVTWK